VNPRSGRTARGTPILDRAGVEGRRQEAAMGKGDQRTGRGKIYRGSYGKTRRHRPKKKVVAKKPAE